MAADEGWEKIDPSSAQPSSDEGWEKIDSSNVDLNSVERKATDVNPFLEGLLQGASFGFSDEAQALMSSILTDKKYRDRWKELQSDIELARTTNPELFYGGDIAGSLASSFIPGIGQVGAIAKTARYTKLAKDISKLAKLKGYASQAANIAKAGAKAGAIQGGISGLGRGGELGGKSITDVGIGGIIGSVFGGALSPIATAGGQAIVPGINFVKEKVIQPVLKSPYMASLAKILPAATKEVMENLPTYIKPKQSVMEAGQELEANMNKFSSDLTLEALRARDKLSDVPNIPIQKAEKIMDDALLEEGATFINKKMSEVKPAGGKKAQGPVFKTIEEFTDSTKGILPMVEKQKELMRAKAFDNNGFVSEKTLRQILDQEIKGHTSWVKGSSEATKPISTAYNKTYGRLNELFNPEYKAAMEPVIEKTREIADLAKAFGFAKGTGAEDLFSQSGNALDDAGQFVFNRHAATDATLNKLRSLPTREVTAQKLLDFSKKNAGSDIGAMARRTWAEKHLEPKRVSMMTAITSSLNPWTLGPIGVLRDVAGPPLWRAAAVHSTPATTPGADFFGNMLTRPMVELFSDPNRYDTQKENLYKP
jgi:hypothetical protein